MLASAPYPWQELQWQAFNQQMEQQKIPHAFLLIGVEGLGQIALAKQMVAALLCTEQHFNQACGHCHSCHIFSAGNHPDHTFIEPEESGKQIKIEQIRRLKDKQELTPTVAKWKTVIISPAENMNINASNSLLKLLEEPQNNTFLLLITAKTEQLPITILSRCQKLVLPPPSQEAAISWLKQQDMQEPQLINLLSLAKGAPLTVLDLEKSDFISQINQIDIDFESLLQGQVNPILLTKSWLSYEPLILFNHLQKSIKQRVIDSGTNENEQMVKRYWFIYDCIINTIKLLSVSNNINKTLLIEQFMVSIIPIEIT